MCFYEHTAVNVGQTCFSLPTFVPCKISFGWQTVDAMAITGKKKKKRRWFWVAGWWAKALLVWAGCRMAAILQKVAGERGKGRKSPLCCRLQMMCLLVRQGGPRPFCCSSTIGPFCSLLFAGNTQDISPVMLFSAYHRFFGYVMPHSATAAKWKSLSVDTLFLLHKHTLRYNSGDTVTLLYRKAVYSSDILRLYIGTYSYTFYSGTRVRVPLVLGHFECLLTQAVPVPQSSG